jgi:Clostripain family
MIYMAADNDLSDFAEANLKEMEEAVENDVINVVALVDWPQASDTYTYLIRNSARETIKQVKNIPSYERQYLEGFVRDTIHSYPADNYCLILWGHGDGIDWVYEDKPKAEGIFTDAGGNLMKIADLGAALGSLAKGQIALLGFDACLMCMAEVYEQIRHSVKLSVGSADEVPKAGMPYGGILGQLVAQPSIGPSNLAKLIVEKYVDSYAHKKLKASFTACELDSCCALTSGMKELARSLTDGLKEPKFLRAIVQSRRQAEIAQENSYVDLGTLCAGLVESAIGKVSELASAVLDTITKDYVLRSERFPRDPERYRSGLSVFFPVSLDARKDRHQEGYRTGTLNARADWDAYRSLAFCQKTNWDEFIQAFIVVHNSAG